MSGQQHNQQYLQPVEVRQLGVLRGHKWRCRTPWAQWCPLRRDRNMYGNQSRTTRPPRADVRRGQANGNDDRFAATGTDD